MRRSLILAVALAVCSLTAYGQDKTPTKKAEPKKADGPAIVIVRTTLPRGWKALGLTAKQKQEVLKTRAQYAAKRQALEKQILELKAEEMADCEKALTTAQLARLKEKK